MMLLNIRYYLAEMLIRLLFLPKVPDCYLSESPARTPESHA
jgi:hypothetical protein